ncbi:MAG TPA: tRNA pseudouridine(55) synthase TruB [Candidatus Desulfaltia sp.]|nr:tRNA pseudouridine(55) synthase TruB [Candidatus Desulfaltia sp.]
MDGLILIDKPRGMTSHDVVARIRRILNQKQVGHFGTLDPLATGLLLVAAGSATRLFPYYSRHDKTYSGEIRLGFSTDTYDALGKPASKKSRLFPERAVLDAAMGRSVGPLNQVPPPYSAKKVDGKPLYRWARANKEVRPRASPVTVYAFRLTAYSPPTLTFEVRCTSGTYIRSLAHDLGQVLGCGAHLSALRRLSAGRHGIHQAHTLEEIEELSGLKKPESFLLPLESLLPEFPKAVMSEGGSRELQKGRPIPETEILRTIPADPASAQPQEFGAAYRIFSLEGRFLALARPFEDRNSLLPFLLL